MDGGLAKGQAGELVWWREQIGWIVNMSGRCVINAINMHHGLLTMVTALILPTVILLLLLVFFYFSYWLEIFGPQICCCAPETISEPFLLCGKAHKEPSGNR